MTRDNIIKLAQEAGLPMAWISDSGVLNWTDLEAFANLVVAAEREECAKVADRFEPFEKTSYVIYASKAIRARGTT